MVKAYNYKELENIYKSRTYLDKSFFDRDRTIVKNRKEKPKGAEERVSDENILNPELKKEP